MGKSAEVLNAMMITATLRGDMLRLVSFLSSCWAVRSPDALSRPAARTMTALNFLGLSVCCIYLEASRIVLYRATLGPPVGGKFPLMRSSWVRLLIRPTFWGSGPTDTSCLYGFPCCRLSANSHRPRLAVSGKSARPSDAVWVSSCSSVGPVGLAGSAGRAMNEEMSTSDRSREPSASLFHTDSTVGPSPAEAGVATCSSCLLRPYEAANRSGTLRPERNPKYLIT